MSVYLSADAPDGVACVDVGAPVVAGEAGRGLGGAAVVTDSELEGVSSIILIFTEICLGTFMFKKP